MKLQIRSNQMEEVQGLYNEYPYVFHHVDIRCKGPGLPPSDCFGSAISSLLNPFIISHTLAILLYDLSVY